VSLRIGTQYAVPSGIAGRKSTMETPGPEGVTLSLLAAEGTG
jgi:hypothetical protein